MVLLDHPIYPPSYFIKGTVKSAIQLAVKYDELIDIHCDEIVNLIDLITKNSAKTLHIENEYGIQEGNPGKTDVYVDGKERISFELKK
ncbi:hypothetical protein AB8U03_07590 [Clostridium sp. Mt-5]|uniref:Uncharacterized protein n=1 Tax=Clostridium moutaii TaxID=3240932 RepID=A0ABV4BR01_9CLOT